MKPASETPSPVLGDARPSSYEGAAVEKPAPGKPGDGSSGFVQEAVEAAKEKAKEEATSWLWNRIVSLLVPVALGAVAGGVTGAVTSYVTTRATKSDGGAPLVVGANASALPGHGVLVVDSVPAGGRVTLDGRVVGTTPIARLDAAAGAHAVVIELTGYDAYTGNVTMQDGMEKRLYATLVQASAPATAVADAPRRRPSGGGSAMPRRDCSGERSDCRSRCSSATFDCSSRCMYCGSCVTSMTWDECNRICNTCRQGCEQNERMCESMCESQYDSCSR